ncbi:NAD(P)H-binding protein [Saccharothrix sp. NRRL B-16314]|uniref:NAD(P)H-binding protein n=1 Tax=Saccharothrix sp. NRRL B-16314 TaxID=1463825 RepID=UPI000524C386|nr:NAD(P)H-binding protein [Saccharothrix sp. NRRL B-16314]
MILITGATGTIGSEVLRLLVERGERVRAVSRSPERLPPGLDVVRADFDDSGTLRLAMPGVKALFLLTAPAKPTPDHDLAVLDAAARTGVGKVVKLSAIGTGETIGDRTVGAWHLVAERAVRDSGLAWTVLRPSGFASNLLAFARPIAAGAPVPNLTGDARQGVVDPRDVAAVAVEALTASVHDGRTYALTGPEPLSVPDQAAILASALGRPVGTVDVPVDAARADMVGRGLDASAVDAMLTGVEWARAGHNAVVTGDVEEVLGRPATSFATWARDHLAAFR